MSNNETISNLVSKIKDTMQPVEERRAALRLLCQLRNESPAIVSSIPEESLSFVVAAATCFGRIAGCKDLTVASAWDALQQGNARRQMKERYQKAL